MRASCDDCWQRWRHWNAEPATLGTRVRGGGGDGHAQELRWSRQRGAARDRAGPALWTPVRVLQSATDDGEGAVLGPERILPGLQTTGARDVLAAGGDAERGAGNGGRGAGAAAGGHRAGGRAKTAAVDAFWYP